MELYGTLVPAVRCYSATRPLHKIFSGVFASIRQPASKEIFIGKKGSFATIRIGLKTNIIIGAGFSKPAGYPAGLTLNQKFFSNVERNILKSSSTEWSWDEYDEITSSNGRLNFDHLNISLLLSELVERFQKETSQVFDYEEFYDWFKLKYGNQEFIEMCCSNVNHRLNTEFKMPQSSLHYFNHPDINQYRIIDECYNHLIADLLRRPYKREEQIDFYTPFIKLINDGMSTNIFSLNHDTLVEFILNKNDILYSDGFSSNKSVIIGTGKEKLEVFCNYYPEKNRLFKLHGSIDYFLFNEMTETGNFLSYTKNYWFFKPITFRNKHNAIRIDPKTGQAIQHFNPNIIPQFVTGKSKLDLISKHLVYKKMYKHFMDSFKSIDTLIVIGYSYSDIHINKIIKTAVDSYDFTIININPFVTFPFRKNYSREKIIEKKGLEELS